MKKRWISLLLVFVMMLSLLSVGVLAETVTPGVVPVFDDDDTGMNQTGGEPGAAVVPEGTGGQWEPGPKGDEDVAVLVYGEAMSNAIAKKTGLFDTFINTLKNSVQGILAGETIPDVEMYLVNDRLQTYKLTPNAVKDAAFLSSFRMKSGGMLSWLDDVFTWLQGGFGWLISDMDTIGDFYKIYGAEDVPEGDYTLMVRSIGRDGYVLREPETGLERVHVGDDHVNYVGYEEYLGGHEFKADLILFDVDIGYIDFYLPGVYLATREPALEFTSADVGGNALPGTEFLMVNRDETLKLVKAALKLGKDTYNNAMQEIDNGAFTWEELNILNYDLLEMDLEGQQINLDYEEAFKLIKTYWALIAAAGDEPLKEFMGTDTDIRIPAVLQTTADQNGLVRFSEDSNITLTWSVEVLLQMAHLVGKEIQDIDDQDILDVMGNFEDSPVLESILLMVIREAKELMVDGIEMWDDSGKVAKDIVNTYLYPILQNDHLLEYADWAMELTKYIPFVDISIPEEIHTVMEYLPQHGILTRKMPAGHYVMLETGTPDGYFRNPLFYTMELTWNTEEPYPDRWCYCSVGNVGLVAPYFAEDYYKQLRELNLNAEADKVLALLNDGRSEELFGSDTPIQDIIEGDADMTARALQMLIGTLYQVTGQTADQAKTVETLLPYFQSSGGTVQNTLKLCDKIVKANKSVITDNITQEWKFYTPTTSIRTNAALKFQAIMKEISKAIVTDDTTITGRVNARVKDTIDKIVDRVDTNNYTEPYVTAVEKAVKSKVSNILSDVLKKAVSTIKKDIGIIAKGDPLPIFSWGKST